jgi:hypothetical protein
MRRGALKTGSLVAAAVLVVMLALAAGVVAGGRPFTTSLTGAAEVPGPGDPDGSGTAKLTLNQGQREVCFQISVQDIAALTAAHIHEAPAGQAGPIVVDLFQGNPRPSGCVTGVGRALIKDIRQNPDEYYVNVHNEEFPDGAVRGQLSK